MSKPIKTTDPSHEAAQGRIALRLDVDDIRWLATNAFRSQQQIAFRWTGQDDEYLVADLKRKTPWDT